MLVQFLHKIAKAKNVTKIAKMNAKFALQVNYLKPDINFQPTHPFKNSFYVALLEKIRKTSQRELFYFVARDLKNRCVFNSLKSCLKYVYIQLDPLIKSLGNKQHVLFTRVFCFAPFCRLGFVFSLNLFLVITIQHTEHLQHKQICIYFPFCQIC